MVPADEVVSWKGCPWEPQDNQERIQIILSILSKKTNVLSSNLIAQNGIKFMTLCIIRAKQPKHEEVFWGIFSLTRSSRTV